MESSDVFTIIGIGLTFLVSLATLVYTIKRNRHSDFISIVTDYRLKWIDLVRIPISEYLLSVDRLERGNKETINGDYALFLEKHWQLQAFLTTFSPKDVAAQSFLEEMYRNAAELIKDNNEDKEAVRKTIRDDLPLASDILRKLMDENWFKVKDELNPEEKCTKR